MMRGRLRKERKVKREREGFYGMEDNDDAEEEGEIVCETSESEFCEPASEEAHRRHLLALKKIQIKTKWKIFLLDYGEKIYYFVKLALALSALALSFAAMAGQSYTPFLYNQF